MDTATAAAAHPTTTTNRDRTIARLSWISAWCAVVLGQLHALSRFATEDGKEDLESAVVRGWAEPAADLLSPLLTWADPDIVYVTYGKLWLPVFVLFTLAAFVAYRHRRPRGFEKWAWRVVLAAYVGACVSVAGEYWTQWSAETNAVIEIVFLASIPIVLVTILGSSVLGVTLFVKGFRPWQSAVLLALTFPGALVIFTVTSMGNIVLPIAFAFGWAARRAAATD